MNVHSKQTAADICSMHTHICAVHMHDWRPYLCVHCRRTFAVLVDVRRHLRIVHRVKLAGTGYSKDTDVHKWQRVDELTGEHNHGWRRLGIFEMCMFRESSK